MSSLRAPVLAIEVESEVRERDFNWPPGFTSGPVSLVHDDYSSHDPSDQPGAYLAEITKPNLLDQRIGFAPIDAAARSIP